MASNFLLCYTPNTSTSNDIKRKHLNTYLYFLIPENLSLRQYLLGRLSWSLCAWGAPILGMLMESSILLWQPCMNLNSCMVFHYKMTLCQIWLSGKLDKYQTLIYTFKTTVIQLKSIQYHKETMWSRPWCSIPCLLVYSKHTKTPPDTQ